MAVLTAAQIEFFRTRGYLVVEDAVEAQLLSELQVAFAARVEESRGERSGRIRSKACFDKLSVRRSFCDCSPSPTRSAGPHPGRIAVPPFGESSYPARIETCASARCPGGSPIR